MGKGRSTGKVLPSLRQALGNPENPFRSQKKELSAFKLKKQKAFQSIENAYWLE